MSISAIQVLLPESPWLGFVPPCTASDPELFFAESPVDLELAKTVCTECPIRKECLEGEFRQFQPLEIEPIRPSDPEGLPPGHHVERDV